MKKFSFKKIIYITVASLFIAGIAQYCIKDYEYRLMGNMQCDEETGACIDRGIK